MNKRKKNEKAKPDITITKIMVTLLGNIRIREK